MFMDQTTSTSSIWCKALTLVERSKTLSKEILLSPRDNRHSQLGKQRFQRWQSQPQFATESIIEQRLALLAIDDEKLIYLLGEPEDRLCQRMPATPTWLIDLVEAYAWPATAYTDLAPGEEELGFLELVQPLVDQACERLHAGVIDLMDQWPSLPFDPDSIEDILLMNLPDPLLMRLGRTLVLELNVARLQGHLDGATPEERFMSFVEQLRLPEASMAILADYPVLARQLVTCINQWTEVSLEFLNRLCADWQSIRRLFSPDSDLGILVELIGGAGDTHRGGRSVMIARFDSEFQIVYKPKSMAVDIHFQDLLSWLNERGCTPPLHTLRIIDCATHGWMEYVEYQECNSAGQVEHFYQRLGLYLALLYAINASDFHLENLIAAGEHPLLIDLETLFNPEFDRFDENEAFLQAQRTMVQSVLVAGMLPQRMWSGDDYGGLDISGLGGEAGQLTPDRLPRPDGLGTDEMRYIREQLELSGEANRPALNGVEVSALDHVEDVVRGFRDMYRLLIKHREGLLAVDGPLDRFAQDEIRVLLRPTRTYDQLLFESFHPDALHDALDRDLLFDRLWLVVPERPFMASAIAAEQGDLQQGDIPVFTTRPVSLELKSGCGETITDVLTETGMALARRRIERLGDEDLQRQEWFIRSSLTTLTPYEFGISKSVKAPYRLSESATEIGREQLLNGARDIADRLAATAVLGKQDVCWIGLEMLAEASWDISPVGMDLYNGIPGIALFLAYAGAILQDDGYTALARRGLAGMLQHFEQFGSDLPGIGGFEGWGGTLYTLTNMGVLWDDTAVLSQAGEVVDVLANFIEQDDVFGVLRGAAGAIGALLTFHDCQPSTKAIDAAIACGDHLLTSAQIFEQGLGWTPPDSSSPPLAGFAHGAAGIGWALLALAEATGEERFRIAGHQAFAYERNLFVQNVGNWPDLRLNDPENGQAAPDSPRFPVAWCHGAAGIGLSRLSAYSVLPDEELHNEIQTALNTTKSCGFGQTHCLCHGDMGNLELLLEAGRILDDETWWFEAQRLRGRVLESIDRYGYYCGGSGGVELPGLMLGIAGIGYQMLRLAEPELVPSVLTLTSPAR
jgi:type 2 lantibiotic biosynthesis protein LanM